MKRVLSLLGAMAWLQGWEGQAYAGMPSQKPVQFYAGLSGGVERMGGRRSESINEDNLVGGRGLTVYRDNWRIRENNAAASIMAGFLWRAPSLPILIGPELYVGRGNVLSSVKDTRLDFTPETRFYSTDFQRKLFYGALLRGGYQFCGKYLAYLSLGVERSQFSTSRVITNDQQNLPTTIVQRTKGFNGFLWGGGFEKRIDRFTVGLDLKMIQYRQQTAVDGVNVTVGIDPAFMNFSVRPQIYSAALRVCYQF